MQKIYTTMIDLWLESSTDVAKELAKRVKLRRQEKHLTQVDLSRKSGVPLATLRRFEQTGLISLQSLLQIAYALESLGEWNALFSQPKWNTIDDMLK